MYSLKKRHASPFLVLLWMLITGWGISFGSQEKPHFKVVDDLSRTVKIPRNSSRILSLQPEMTRIIFALGAGDQLVGLDYFIRRYDHLFPLISARHSSLPLVSISSESVNIELVLRLKPDVIFASPSEFQVPESIQAKTRIPVLALSSMGRFEKLIREIRLAGQVIGRKKRAEDLISYFLKKIGFISSRISASKEEEKPRVYLSFWSYLSRTPVFYEPVNVAGGTNVAEGLLPEYLGTIGTVVELEKIYEWDPDIILVQGNYPPEQRVVSVPLILSDRRLGSLKAVRNKKVFYTFGFWYWWDPAEVLVETVYLAKLFYPQKFGDVDVETEGNAIFYKFYGIKEGFTTLCRMLECREWIHE